MKKMLPLFLCLCLLFSLSACGSSPREEPENEPTPQEDPTPEPESKSEPEPEPEPEPLVIPDPIVYSGSGDSVLEISPFDGPWMLHIVGNSAGRHFAVTGYDSNSEYVEGLVNTTDPYDGFVFDHTQSTTALEIKAEGDWAVEIVSVYSAQLCSAEEPATGTGDAVLWLKWPDVLWALHITGNQDEHHFAVKGYDDNLNYTELFVSTTDSYDGITIDVTQTTGILAVTAESSWTIAPVEARTLQEANEGNTITGNGDMVIMTDTVGKTATISGNAGAHHFAVKSYSYTDSDLLVNTTEAYEGTVMLKFDPTLIVVTAQGDWTIQF